MTRRSKSPDYVLDLTAKAEEGVTPEDIRRVEIQLPEGTDPKEVAKRLSQQEAAAAQFRARKKMRRTKKGAGL